MPPQAAGQHCILVTRGEETGQCNLILCNSIGTPVDSNTMMVEPLCLAMTTTHVVAASKDTVFVWLYNPIAGVRFCSATLAWFLLFSSLAIQRKLYNFPHMHWAQLLSYCMRGCELRPRS